MKTIKYFLGLTLLLATAMSCKKEYTDTSFVEQASAPAKLGVLFNTAKDGNVTIVPSGEGVTSFDVYFGDGGQTFVKVEPGKTVSHKYAGGKYTVKIVGHGIGGKTAQLMQELTVSLPL